MNNWTSKALDCLHKNPNERFTCREMAEWIFDNHYDECEEKRKRTQPNFTNNQLISQISSEIRGETLKDSDGINTINIPGKRGEHFYFTTNFTTNNEMVKKEPATNIEKPSEQDLYPKLNNYLKNTLNIHNKRIDEKKSSNTKGKNANKWLYPDVVGMKVLSTNWEDTITKCAKLHSDKQIQMWSFEVKIKINMSNIRESFFQTVSNSSWANFGYLVAKDIEQKALQQLHILSNLHGIGFIKLNYENPKDSVMVIPARENSKVDWNNINAIFEQNTDFQKYIDQIDNFLQRGIIYPKNWD